MKSVTPVTRVTLCCIQQLQTDIVEDFEYCRVPWQKSSRSLLHASLGVSACKQEIRGYLSIRTAGSSNKVQDVILEGVIETSLFRDSVIPCDICAEITFPCYNIHQI